MASQILKILVVGLDTEINEWFRSAVTAAKLPWRVRIIEALRVGAPEADLLHQDLVVVVWNRVPSVSLDEVLNRSAPPTRSPEGILCDLEMAGGEALRLKTVALGRSFLREDTVLLAESGVRLVLTLPEKRKQWDAESDAVLQRISKFHAESVDMASRKEEVAIRKFMNLMGSWGRMSDEARMNAVDSLALLGDTARYAELMARKALKEGDKSAAEAWLKRAIHKNPNYLQAMKLLADLYISGKRYSEAMALLQKLHLNSPRNISRLARLGDCLISMGEYQKAEQILQEALSIDEFHAEAREALGKVKCVLGDYDTARKLLAHAQNQRELAVFLNLVGVQLVERGDFAKAIHHYKHAQFVLPGNDQSHMIFFNIALAYLKWGKPGEALKYARLAVARDPHYEKATKLVAYVEKLCRRPAAA